MTRSDRVFSPRSVEHLAKAKGKEYATNTQNPAQNVESHEESSTPKVASSQKEAGEFLQIIKKSDFKMVDQLNQTPTKISMLSLMLSLEAHREPLMKVLGATHVTKDIMVDQFDGVVANIIVESYLGFNNDKLPSEGRAHSRALHISMKCVDIILSRVFVGIRSSLNIIPKSIMLKMSLNGVAMKLSALIVKAFYGSRRVVIGEVDLPIKIGLNTFSITFQVMDTHPRYSCLLGRP